MSKIYPLGFVPVGATMRNGGRLELQATAQRPVLIRRLSISTWAHWSPTDEDRDTLTIIADELERMAVPVPTHIVDDYDRLAWLADGFVAKSTDDLARLRGMLSPRPRASSLGNELGAAGDRSLMVDDLIVGMNSQLMSGNPFPAFALCDPQLSVELNVSARAGETITIRLSDEKTETPFCLSIAAFCRVPD